MPLSVLDLGGVAGSWERVSIGNSSPSRRLPFSASCWNVESSVPDPTITSDRARSEELSPLILASSVVIHTPQLNEPYSGTPLNWDRLKCPE